MNLPDIRTHVFICYASLLILLTYSASSFGQCAGNDSNIDICNKDNDVSSRTFDLFNQLNGAPTPGGTWSTSNPANFFALNQNTGEVDLWRINNFGVHVFTYTNTACNESATVTINLGGYPGENNIDGSANACSDDTMVNLHGFLGSEVDGKVQDFNGLWEEDPSTVTNQLEKNIFNAQAAGPGIYIFTYTVNAVSSCPSRTSTVILEVHPSPNPGIANSLTFCTNEDFSAYRNFDLNSQLTGEDLNGTWSENGTNQLDDLNDSIINIEELNNTYGYNTFSFTYTVYPTHPVCEEREVTVNIDILPVLDGEMSADNFCFGTDYTVNLTYDNTILHNGSFELGYTINGNPGLASAVLTNGVADFIVDPDLVPLNQFVTLEITSISSVTPMRDVCPVVIVPPTTFLVSNASVNVQDICVDTNTQITLVNILNQSASFANEILELNYTLTTPNGNDHSYGPLNVTFADGAASFDIDASNFVNDGNYNITINIPDSFPLNCELEDSFTVTPTPDEIQLDLLVDNYCNATQIDVLVDAPILSNGEYDITYDVINQDDGQVVLENTINFMGGTATYDLDVEPLPQGNYTVSVRSFQNDTTPCRIQFEFEESENFAINGVPVPPEAEAIQTFCLGEFTLGGPTLADINVTASGDILFYATQTDMDILAMDTILEDNEDYFISNTDPSNNCEGSERVQVVVSLLASPAPTVLDPNPTFCSSDQPTLQNLEVHVNSSGTIVWFDTATGGSPLPTETLLIDSKSYFAANENTGSCISTERIEIIPTIFEIPPANIEQSSLELCGLDAPTVANLRVAEGSNSFDIIWFGSTESNTPLEASDLLQSGKTYYAASYNPNTGCTNEERIPVTVDLSNCSPEDYGFYIPDGFSPNNDGRNDTFFIPNIEIIFPDFTIEILNRYGATLFKGNRAKPSWDGSDRGKFAPNGVYFYIINYNKDGHESIQGRLYLNR